MARWIAGLDGCRGAWAGALMDLDDPERFRCGRFDSVAAVLDSPEAPRVAGIDVPIGLPERIVGGGRAADLAARARLGPARASVFSMPPRAAIFAADYETAKELSRQGSEPPFAPSIQGWNIFRYVREVDTLLRSRPDLRRRLHEVHPEIAFHALNGLRPLGLPKKGPRRHEGLALRRTLLAAAGLPRALIAARPADVPADDHLDALAGLVTARDILLGRAQSLPDPPEQDAHGLPVAIWAPAPVTSGNLRPRSAGMSPPVRHIARAIVLDPADRVLLIEYSSVHAKGPDGGPLHFWFMPGGGLEPGEDHVTACARELGEEIGRSDVEIGPQVASCDGPFHLFRQPRDARERYFLVRLPDDRVDTSRLAETEDNPVVGTRWWTLSDLQATEERIEPAGLAGVIAHLVSGTTPQVPTVLTWHNP